MASLQELFGTNNLNEVTVEQFVALSVEDFKSLSDADRERIEREVSDRDAEFERNYEANIERIATLTTKAELYAEDGRTLDADEAKELEDLQQWREDYRLLTDEVVSQFDAWDTQQDEAERLQAEATAAQERDDSYVDGLDDIAAREGVKVDAFNTGGLNYTSLEQERYENALVQIQTMVEDNPETPVEELIASYPILVATYDAYMENAANELRAKQQEVDAAIESGDQEKAGELLGEFNAFADNVKFELNDELQGIKDGVTQNYQDMLDKEINERSNNAMAARYEAIGVAANEQATEKAMQQVAESIIQYGSYEYAGEDNPLVVHSGSMSMDVDGFHFDIAYHEVPQDLLKETAERIYEEKIEAVMNGDISYADAFANNSAMLDQFQQDERYYSVVKSEIDSGAITLEEAFKNSPDSFERTYLESRDDATKQLLEVVIAADGSDAVQAILDAAHPIDADRVKNVLAEQYAELHGVDLDAGWKTFIEDKVGFELPLDGDTEYEENVLSDITNDNSIPESALMEAQAALSVNGVDLDAMLDKDHAGTTIEPPIAGAGQAPQTGASVEGR